MDVEHHDTIAKTVVGLLNAKYGGKTGKSETSNVKTNVDFDPEWLDKLLVKAQDHPDLADNERSFIDSMTDRFGKYQDRTFISPNQMSWLKDIEERVG